MRSRWGGLLCVGLIIGMQGLCGAGELKGKLVRIDHRTLTLSAVTQGRLTLSVDTERRRQAAAHLGKTVTVHVREDQGRQRAVRIVPRRPAR